MGENIQVVKELLSWHSSYKQETYICNKKYSFKKIQIVPGSGSAHL